MSRSRKKTPVSGITTARSEKQDKRLANRRLRRATNAKLASGADSSLLPVANDVGNVWCFDKDGKRRFDPDKHPRLMRK